MSKTILLLSLTIAASQAMASEIPATTNVFQCLRQFYTRDTRFVRKNTTTEIISSREKEPLKLKTQRYRVWDQDVFAVNDLDSEKKPGFYLITKNKIYFFSYKGKGNSDLHLSFHVPHHTPLYLDFDKSERSFFPDLAVLKPGLSKGERATELKAKIHLRSPKIASISDLNPVLQKGIGELTSLRQDETDNVVNGAWEDETAQEAAHTIDLIKDDDAFRFPVCATVPSAEIKNALEAAQTTERDLIARLQKQIPDAATKDDQSPLSAEKTN